MKMTMHIDEALLDRVMTRHGFATKTEAVEMALREMDRKNSLAAMLKTGLGFSSAELKAAVEPSYDVHRYRVAEPAAPYGKPRRRKRSS